MARDAIVRFRVDDGEATSKLQRLDVALSRFERGEASRVIRGTAMAFEHMAASAIGVEGPLGRIASQLLMFSTGAGLGATAAIAGLAAGFHVLDQVGEKLDETLRNVNMQVATLAKADFSKFLIGIQDTQAKIEKLSEPSFMQNVLGTAAFIVGGKGLEESVTHSFLFRGRESELAGLQTGIANQLLGVPGAREQSEQAARERKVRRNLELFNGAYRFDPNNAFGTPTGFQLPGGDFGAAARARFSGQGVLLGGGTSQMEQELRKIFAGLETPIERIRHQIDLVKQAQADGLDIGEDYDRALHRLNEAMAKATARSDQLGLTIVTAVSGAIAAIASGGGAGAALGGIGSLIGAIPGPHNKLIGAGVAGLGAIVSLFDHKDKTPEVIVAGYGDRALSQEQQIMSALTGALALQIGLVGVSAGNRDQVIAELARSSRLGPGGIRIPAGGARG